MKEKNKKVVKAAPKKTAAKKTVTKKTATKPVVKKTTTAATKTSSKVTVKKVTKKPTTVKKPTPVKKVTPVVKKKTAEPKKVEVKKEVINPEEKFAYKKYIYYVGLITLAFILIIAVYEFATYYSYERYNYSYLLTSGTVDKKNVLKLETAKDTLSNLSGNYFIYISTTEDDETFQLEKQMTKLIKKYDLESIFYYLNVDNIYETKDYIDRINFNLNFNDVKITRVPVIIYINRNNEIIYNNVIDDRNGTMNVGDFQKLLDINGFTTK